MQAHEQNRAIRPVGEYCLVRPVEGEEVSEGGILLPGKGNNEGQIGRLIETGDDVDATDLGRVDDETGPSAHDPGVDYLTVAYVPHSEIEVRHGGVTWHLVKAEHVIAVIG